MGAHRRVRAHCLLTPLESDLSNGKAGLAFNRRNTRGGYRPWADVAVSGKQTFNVGVQATAEGNGVP